jgi:hypothetical protein
MGTNPRYEDDSLRAGDGCLFRALPQVRVTPNGPEMILPNNAKHIHPEPTPKDNDSQ